MRKDTYITTATACLFIASCTPSSPEIETSQSVPLPRARPSLPRTEPQTAAVPEAIKNVSAEPAATNWRLCKLLVADRLAQNADRPVEEIMTATFTACSAQQEELRVALGRHGLQPEVIEDAVAAIQKSDERQLWARIIAVRQSR